jgi:type I restriction enzyme S subunit
MNADGLLAHYERIADTPDAIPRLRPFILDLAVRGKLVPQDANDLMAKNYSDEPSSDDLPSNWRVLNFGKFCDIEGGNQPPKSQFISEPKKGYVRLLQIRDLGERPVPTFIPIGSTNRFCKEGEILIGRYGASVGKIFWAQNGAYNVALTKFIWPEDAWIASFAFLLLKSEYFQGRLAGATRSAQAGFNKGDLAAINFPLPPLAEQHRIVAKVDELMALCDRLETARAKRETTRDRLAAASLARLNVPDHDPVTFADHARFALDALPILSTRPDQIKELRQTILNLAVRGKLVPQDLNDEPASELLKRISAEKARRIKEGKLRKQKSLPPIKDDEIEFELAPGWQWGRMAEVIKLWNGYAFKSGDFQSQGIPVVRIGDLQNGEVTLSDAVYVSDAVAKTVTAEVWIPPDALLIAMSGATTGKTAFNRTRSPLLLNQRVGRIEVFLMSVHFIRFFFETIIARNLSISFGTAIPNLSVEQINETVVPIPPVAEQHRIVAKVDELMALCDRLEASLTTGDDTRSRLLDALLAEALSPVLTIDREAAE